MAKNPVDARKFVDTRDPLGQPVPLPPPPIPMPERRVQLPAISEETGIFTISGPEAKEPAVWKGTRPRWNFKYIQEQNELFNMLTNKTANFWWDHAKVIPYYPWTVGVKVLAGAEEVWPFPTLSLTWRSDLFRLAFLAFLAAFWFWLAGYDIHHVPNNNCNKPEYLADNHHPHLQALVDFYRRATFQIEQWLYGNTIDTEPDDDDDDETLSGISDFLSDSGSSDMIDTVIGGQNAAIEEYGWVVAIGVQAFPGNFLYSREADEIPLTGCSGSVIEAEWVITAMHCVPNFLDLAWVTAGTDCRPELGGILEPGAQVRYATRAYHRDLWPRYLNERSDWMVSGLMSFQFTKRYFGSLLRAGADPPDPPTDIALLRLNEPLPLGDKIEKVRWEGPKTAASDGIPVPNPWERVMLDYAGWGFTGVETTGQMGLRLQRIAFNTTLNPGPTALARPEITRELYTQRLLLDKYECFPLSRVGCWHVPQILGHQAAKGDSGSGIVWRGGGGGTLSSEDDEPPEPLLVGIISTGAMDPMTQTSSLGPHILTKPSGMSGYMYVIVFPWIRYHEEYILTTFVHEAIFGAATNGSHMYQAGFDDD